MIYLTEKLRHEIAREDFKEYMELVSLVKAHRAKIKPNSYTFMSHVSPEDSLRFAKLFNKFKKPKFQQRRRGRGPRAPKIPGIFNDLKVTDEGVTHYSIYVDKKRTVGAKWIMGRS